jgi:putative aldouronate transport system permease protein
MVGNTPGRKAFTIFNYCFLTLLSLVMLFPFLHITAGSFSGGLAISQGRVDLWPVEFTLDNYKAVMKNISIWRSFGVTIYVTMMGTFINLVMTCLMAYGLSKTFLKGRTIIMILILFTMIFQAPMIPTYLVVKSVGLLDTLWALMIPAAISAFNLIIMITFFKNIPQELIDSAKIDGCDEYRTLWKIVLPLSLASLYTIGLFYAVGHWNGYMQALFYIRDTDLYPLQIKLRQLIVVSESMDNPSYSSGSIHQSPEGIKMASILVATVPILLVYPFIQKHFVKGAMLGSLKG